MTFEDKIVAMPNTYFIEANGISYDGRDLDMLHMMDWEDEIEIPDHHGNVIHISKYVKPECEKYGSEIIYTWKFTDSLVQICFLCG